jgi:capsular polysaccharide transport system permease protein
VTLEIVGYVVQRIHILRTWSVRVMEIEQKRQVGGGAIAVLDRARVLSQAISEAARRARLSTRGQRIYSSGGFRARRGAAILRLAVMVSFILMVVAPTLAASIYYVFIASDQYVAEARFTVSPGMPPAIDGMGGFTGSAAMAVIQDTQIVTNYVQSRAGVEKLDKLIDIRDLYSTDAADWLSRFNKKKPIERFIKYWQSMCSISIGLSSGIVDLKVRAFSPEDAARIAQGVVDMSEELVNALNERMNHDAVASAEEELRRTSQRLKASQVALEKARNEEGLLDAPKAADALNNLITATSSVLLQLQGKYATQRNFVSEDAPQMLALKSRIEATSAQIADLRSQLTNRSADPTTETTLSSSITKFAELDLEKNTAEHLYAGSVSALEMAQMTAERQLMYINTFVKPVAPEQPEYPKRLLYSGLVASGSLALWGICCGLAMLIRNNMA